VLQTFGDTVRAQGIVLRNIETGAAVSIQPGCNGVEAMIVVMAAIAATPASWKHKLWGIGVGFAAIHALNLARIISLFYLLQWNPAWFEWARLYLWQALVMLDGFIVCRRPNGRRRRHRGRINLAAMPRGLPPSR
jgi:exosortase H (IPTLxxWG-CTERM-specific)